MIVSRCAAGGTWYWKTYYPEGGRPSIHATPPSNGAMRSLRAPSAREMMTPRSSGRQDLAMTVSILSSVVSALAAVAQAWFARNRL
ncbi:MAG: hypothetical protein P8Y47_11280, partial [Alphaproteobacteria bacterium]